MTARLYFIDGPFVIGGPIVKRVILDNLFSNCAKFKHKKWIIHDNYEGTEVVAVSDNIINTGPWNKDNEKNWKKICTGKSSNNYEQCSEIASEIFEEGRGGSVIVCIGGYNIYTNLYKKIANLFKTHCKKDNGMACLVLHTIPSFTEAIQFLFSEVKAGINAANNKDDMDKLLKINDVINGGRANFLNNWSSYHIAASHIFNSLNARLPDHRGSFIGLPVSDICSGVLAGNERGLICKELPIAMKLPVMQSVDGELDGLINYYTDGIPPSINPWRRVIDVDAWKHVVEYEAIPPKS